jgi:hypothetical protein
MEGKFAGIFLPLEKRQLFEGISKVAVRWMKGETAEHKRELKIEG